MTRNAVASWVWISGLLLACSGRFEVGVNDMRVAGAAGASNHEGSTFGGATQGPTVQTGDVGGSMAIGSSAMGGTSTGPGMSTNAVGNVRSSACGVPLGQPGALTQPVTTRGQQWWQRVAKLVWGESREVPTDVPATIDYARAGELADAEIDRAIDETGGIPGADGFVRWWLRLGGLYDGDLVNAWSKRLGGTLPAPTVLLTSTYDATRRGVFTEPGFLQTYETISRRGYVMVESIFGIAVPPEPPGTPVFEPPVGMARRDALQQSVSSPQCGSCHQLFDPFGYSLENYDALGEYTTVDAGKPVDASGTLSAFEMSNAVSFMSYADLASQLHERCDVNLAFADRFFAYALELSNVPNSVPAAHTEDQARIQQAFIRSSRSYRSLIKAFAQSQAIDEYEVVAK